TVLLVLRDGGKILLFKNKTFSFFVLIIVISIFLVWLSPSFTFSVWVDKLFMVSLFATMVGAVMYLIEKQFFDTFLKNFRYFLKKINKKSQMADEIEQKNHHQTNDFPLKFRTTYPILIAGASLLFLAIVFSIIQ